MHQVHGIKEFIISQANAAYKETQAM